MDNEKWWNILALADDDAISKNQTNSEIFIAKCAFAACDLS